MLWGVYVRIGVFRGEKGCLGYNGVFGALMGALRCLVVKGVFGDVKDVGDILGCLGCK